jgi:LysR family glycine cleavage system transcriptional activator
VRLFNIAVKCPFSYYLVCPPGALQKTQVQAFRTWLFDQVDKLDALPIVNA